MWRLFYKSILISIISSMLMLGDMVAYADTQGTPTKGSDGKVSVTNTYDLAAKDAQQDGFLDILTAFAVGVIGTKLLTYEKWTYDMMVAAAGSAIYLVGSVMNIIQTRKELENIKLSVKYSSDGTVDSKQVEYIKSLRESYVKVEESLERLKSLQKGAMYSFYAAAAVALVQRFRTEGKKMSCEYAVTQAQIKIKVACSTATASTAGTAGASCAECMTSLAAFETMVKSITVKKEAFGMTSISKAGTVGTEIKAAGAKLYAACNLPPAAALKQTIVNYPCSVYLEEEEMEKAYDPKVIDPTGYNKSFEQFFLKNDFRKAIANDKKNRNPFYEFQTRNILKRMSVLFVDDAQAGWPALLGLGVGAAAAFFTQTTVIGRKLDTYLYSPTGRIAGWTAMGLLVQVAIDKTEDKIANVKDNIDKIDRILEETSKLSKGIKASNAIIKTVQLNNALFTNMSDVSLPNGEKVSCIVKSTTSSSACASSTSLASQLSAFNNLPDGVKSLASDVNKVSDSLSGQSSLSGTTLAQAANIGNNKAISKMLKDQQKALNDLLGKQGKPLLNYEVDGNNFKNDLLKTMANGVEKMNASDKASLLASIGSGPIGNVDSKTSSPTSTASNAVKKLKPTTSVTAAPVTNKDNLDFKDLNSKDEQAILTNGMREGSANDRYDIKENDINKDKGISIFEVISSRYKNSAYPKLLEEVK